MSQGIFETELYQLIKSVKTNIMNTAVGKDNDFRLPFFLCSEVSLINNLNSVYERQGSFHCPMTNRLKDSQ